MKKSHLLAASAILVVLVAAVVSTGLGLPNAQAQQAASGATVRPPFVLLDVSRAFKDSLHFKSMMEEMKVAVQQAEAQVKAEQEAIRKGAEELKRFQKGSPDYRSQEEALAKRAANLKITVERQRKDFLDREAKVYHRIYQEVQQQVDYYCKQTGIAMVLRFNSTPLGPNPGAQEVLQTINKPVVYHNQALDITDWVVKSLNARVPGPADRMGRIHPGVTPN